MLFRAIIIIAETALVYIASLFLLASELSMPLDTLLANISHYPNCAWNIFYHWEAEEVKIQEVSFRNTVIQTLLEIPLTPATCNITGVSQMLGGTNNLNIAPMGSDTETPLSVSLTMSKKQEVLNFS